MSFAIVSARHVTAVCFMSERLRVGRQMILEAVCVMPVSLFLLEMMNMLKKHEERHSRLNCAFCYSTTGGERQQTSTDVLMTVELGV